LKFEKNEPLKDTEAKVTHLDICRAKTKGPDLELLFRLFGRTGPSQFYSET